MNKKIWDRNHLAVELIVMRYLGNNIKKTINNHAVSFSDEGSDDGPVVIFIHGSPVTKTMLNMRIDSLNDDFRVISYDILSSGNSDTVEEKTSTDLFVKDLLCLMDSLKIEKAMLCGFSVGAQIALNAIENYPDRFSSLIMGDNQYEIN